MQHRTDSTFAAAKRRSSLQAVTRRFSLQAVTRRFSLQTVKRRFTVALAISLLLAGGSGAAASSRWARWMPHLSGGTRAEAATKATGPRVVLLHGLTRSPRSMSSMEDALREAGYQVCNIAYPSREHTIEVLASDYVAPEVAKCFPGSDGPIDFVTHSMGGILVRQMAATHAVASIGRVVMLGPPNAGSEIVDHLGSLWLFRAIHGPAGVELGTAPDSVPRRLGPATFEVGIIAGDKSRNWLVSRYLPGENDGKVSVASAQLAGMKDFLVIDANHTFMTSNGEAIAQTLHFLKDGAFEHREVAAN